RMRRLQARAFTIDLPVGVSEVRKDVFNESAGSEDNHAFAIALHAQQLVPVDLEIPGEIVFPSLQNGPGGTRSIAATLHLDLVKQGTFRDVVVRMELRKDDVVRTKLDKFIRARADRPQICWSVSRFFALVGFENVARKNRTQLTTPGS